MKSVILKSKRSAPFRNRHPWLFSGAIDRVMGNPAPGDWVAVLDDTKSFVAYGLFNPHSQIRVRLYSFDEKDIISDEFWQDKIHNSIALRANILNFKPLPDNAYRLINSEGDGLSGLTVDRYGNYLCVQFTSLALYHYQEIILSSLKEALNPRGIVIRTEADILQEENLELKDGTVFGSLPEEPVVISENCVLFETNLATGQKTGFYLDQRANRILLESFASGKTVLDLCTYTGGFALHAAKAGAKEVIAVDVSASALEIAKRNAELNHFTDIEFIKSDMFKYLDKCLSDSRKFDVIILDPPKMTHSKGSVNNALMGYLKLNTAALKCLNPVGILFTCSCSGRVSREDFLSTLNRASVQANRALQILEVRGADIDHPVSSACPESEYLKCVVCYVQ